jgi:hypothetical protein
MRRAYRGKKESSCRALAHPVALLRRFTLLARSTGLLTNLFRPRRRAMQATVNTNPSVALQLR